MNKEDELMFAGWSRLSMFKRKVWQAKELIKESLSIAPAYVACSWGKDSIVLTHLCQSIQHDIPVISFSHPERELISNYKEVESTYCDRFSPQLITISIQGDHVPVKVSETKLWKKYPVALVGLRTEESSNRSRSLRKYGLIHQFKTGNRAGTWRACPIGWWGWKDVWGYIVANKLPYLETYNQLSFSKGRTTDHLSKETNKWWQRKRLEEFAITAPGYYHYLRDNYPEMF